MEIPERFIKYVDYIRNIGGSPRIEWFDDDWEPIGPMLRNDMAKAGLIIERNGKIYLSAAILVPQQPKEI